MGCIPLSAVVGVSAAAVGKKSRRKEKTSPLTGVQSEYDIGEKLGKGSHGQVHIAIRRHTPVAVAIKVSNLHSEQGKDKVQQSINELTLWSTVGTHANCVQLLDSFFDDHLAYMVMEKCDCSLFTYLLQREVVYETCLGKVFEQMLTGISHIHSVSVFHRDIKPDNFLVSGNTVKICDFGMSVMVPKDGPMGGFAKGIVGTAPFLPPEMLAGESYDQKADVWSFGVVAYLLLCGNFPYKSSDGSPSMMKKSILKGVAADCDKEWLTNNANNFLQQVLQRKPSQRPTATLALQLPFITNPFTQPLSSLHRALIKASQVGACDSRDLLSVTDTDNMLQKLKNGKLENRPIQKMDEFLHDDGVSTACGSSSYSSAASKQLLSMTSSLDDN